ncbi:anthrone oxygenase family protein [Agromyces sp. LHK192]|uniref:anthrone oxygenase family protein n=1 Tax=Agromyces sp. LHK192 TaxID=2498704 RepID=UPI000FDBE360|nr:anthrone oxygenase family protein [Agromyces sp. LHK192]
MDGWILALLVIATVGAGVAGGIFFAFSGFVVQGLERLAPADAARAMRGINETALRPPLMLELFGTALVAAAVAVLVLVAPGPETWWTVAAAAVYVVTVVVVTAAANVPRNDALMRAPADDAALAAAWAAFRPGWMGWNHVRTLGASVSCGLFAIALALAW